MLYEFLLPMLCPSGDVRKETDAQGSQTSLEGLSDTRLKADISESSF